MRHFLWLDPFGELLRRNEAERLARFFEQRGAVVVGFLGDPRRVVVADVRVVTGMFYFALVISGLISLYQLPSDDRET